MDNTRVMVYFSLYGDEFPLDYVSNKLKIEPTRSYRKGDLIPNRPTAVYRKETSWDLGTEYEESFDVNEQLQKILQQLQNKSSIINELKKAYSLECKFFIVIKIEDGLAPALYLSKDIIKFASIIKAEFDIDLYANPYESDYLN
ncbi:DUF4279 domain-containing protein [Mesobacillus subterraneus]|uniref:DUF4279 domain-containing protein n=1 Tax=Mesobacillus subterraneus TaxID=285983 RepID=UPI002041FDCF|nr:DUF4279 domain-containing protein [Mesobacillus subterraneus]MCM3666271.1 DUF4279 domain-containing protein [Mesobacillus subterraneus]MCM3685270.1 DUF4279 domain-containing protein [Mesobacillus subterraneus]